MAELILAILLAFFVHEGGHWMAARLFSGSGSSFASRGDDSTCLVSSVWTMPYLPKSKQRIVALWPGS